MCRSCEYETRLHFSSAQIQQTLSRITCQHLGFSPGFDERCIEHCLLRYYKENKIRIWKKVNHLCSANTTLPRAINENSNVDDITNAMSLPETIG